MYFYFELDKNWGFFKISLRVPKEMLFKQGYFFDLGIFIPRIGNFLSSDFFP